MNPGLDAEFLAAEERRDPDGFRGEYLAELVGSGGAFLDPELVDSAVVSRGELDPDACDSWIAGYDPSFTSDPSAVVLVARDRTVRDRLVVGCVRTWPPPKGRKTEREARRVLEDRVLGEVADLCERYGVRAVCTDNYLPASSTRPCEGVVSGSRHEPLTTASKLELFSGVRARLASGSLELSDDPLLVSGAEAAPLHLPGRRASGGDARLQGTHCDSAIALALAVAYIDKDGPPGTGSRFSLPGEDRASVAVFGISREVEVPSTS